LSKNKGSPLKDRPLRNPGHSDSDQGRRSALAQRGRHPKITCCRRGLQCKEYSPCRVG